MYYYQFNIGDYVSSTQHLSELEDLAYRRMIDVYYSKESPLPKDIDQIARLIRMRTHSDCIAIVLQEFFTLKKDGYHCERADKEISAFKSKSDKARKSASIRWNKNKKLPSCERIANAKQTHSEGNAKHKTLNTKQETLNNSKDYAFLGETIRLTEKDFQKWLALYPNLNLTKELQQLDMECRGDKKWFMTVSSKLNYRNKNATPVQNGPRMFTQ